MPDTSSLLEEDVNIAEFPSLDETCTVNSHEQLTIGDLHANALKFLYFLVRHGVISMTKEDYQAFVNIYKKSTCSLKKSDIEEFDQIVNRMFVRNKAMVRLIGDELADRGSNDYFILKLIEKLSQADVPLEIMLSNHSSDFILAYENLLNGKETKLTAPFLKWPYSNSLSNLQALIDSDLVSIDDIKEIYENHYAQNLKVLSCTLTEDEEKMSIYSHAPIDLKNIQGLAQKYNVKYDAGSNRTLAQVIEEINNSFQQQLMVYKFSDSYRLKILRFFDDLSPIDHPVEYVTWNRNINDLIRCSEGNLCIIWIHGHDSGGQSNDSIHNLDSILGKCEIFDYGRYKITYSCEKSLKMIESASFNLVELFSQDDIPSITKPASQLILGKCS